MLNLLKSDEIDKKAAASSGGWSMQQDLSVVLNLLKSDAMECSWGSS